VEKTMTIVSIRENKIEPIFEIISEDQQNLLDNIVVLNLLDNILILPASIIWRNIYALLSYKKWSTRQIAAQGMDFLFDSSVHMGELIRHIMNILTSFRSFTDTTSHRVDELFGSDFGAQAIFKDQISKQYDAVFAYRFLYRLRNFTQHYGIPLDDIQISIERLNDGQLMYHLSLDRNKLLDYDGWSLVKKEIEALPEHIHIENYFIELYKCVEKIQFHMINLYITANKEMIDSMLLLYNKAKEKAHEDQIGVMIPDTDKNEARIIYLNITLLEIIEKVMNRTSQDT
jgi:hypothetical protein